MSGAVLAPVHPVAALTSAAVAAPSPPPTPAAQVDPTFGSPGILGFVFTFLVALALIGLVMSLARQLRRVDRNARLAAVTEHSADSRSAASEGSAAGATNPSDATRSTAARDGEGGQEPGGKPGAERVADEPGPDEPGPDESGNRT